MLIFIIICINIYIDGSIYFSSTSHRDAHDLYKVWAGKGSASGSRNTNGLSRLNSVAAATHVAPADKATTLIQRPRAALPQPRGNEGALSRQLKAERDARIAVSRERLDGRHSRFCGQFVVNNALGDSAAIPNEGLAEASAAKIESDSSQPSDQMPMSRYTIVNNPFAGVFQRRESSRKNEKKSAPFLMVVKLYCYCCGYNYFRVG